MLYFMCTVVRMFLLLASGRSSHLYSSYHMGVTDDHRHCDDYAPLLYSTVVSSRSLSNCTATVQYVSVDRVPREARNHTSEPSDQVSQSLEGVQIIP